MDVPGNSADGVAGSTVGAVWGLVYWVLTLPFSIFESDVDAHKAGVFRRAHSAGNYEREMGLPTTNPPVPEGADPRVCLPPGAALSRAAAARHRPYATRAHQSSCPTRSGKRRTSRRRCAGCVSLSTVRLQVPITFARSVPAVDPGVPEMTVRYVARLMSALSRRRQPWFGKWGLLTGSAPALSGL